MPSTIDSTMSKDRCVPCPQRGFKIVKEKQEAHETLSHWFVG